MTLSTSKSNLHPEEIAQLREFVLEQCKLGNQSTRGIIEILEMNEQRYHIGIISSTKNKYIDSLYN